MCYNGDMRIIFPELTTNSIAKEAAKSSEGIEFLPADNLNEACEMLSQADSMISGLDHSSRDVLLAYKEHVPLKSKFFSAIKFGGLDCCPLASSARISFH